MLQPGRRPLLVVVDRPLEVGRDCDGLLIADPRASRRHCMLTPHGTTLQVEDLGSTNGISVNGTAAGFGSLDIGDVLTLGDTRIQLVKLPGVDDLVPRATMDTMVHGAVNARRTSVIDVADAVTSQLPAQPMRRLGAAPGRQTGTTVTIVFSDIESSSAMAERLGDRQWFELLEAHNLIIRTRLRELGGQEVKNQGDGFMLTFASARRAVLFAIACQRDIAAHNRDDPRLAFRIRMGLHTGEAMTADGDLFGKHVVIASRIADAADGGQILASTLVKEIVSSGGDVAFGASRVLTLKGLSGTYEAFEIPWQADGDDARAPGKDEEHGLDGPDDLGSLGAGREPAGELGPGIDLT
ncbi:MAG: adenylate/guanylate cyclase domain-containing protein [Actinomycetota bacterium]|nr:adenylate/guanylate cyclase domain-containing protein [Actinomycetota bacterium]